MPFDAFLKVDGIDGESQDSKHKSEIELLSYSFGADQPATSSVGGGSGAGYTLNVSGLPSGLSFSGTGQPKGADGLPSEQLSLNFSKINFEYKEQGADGSLKGTVAGGYDVKANKKV